MRLSPQYVNVFIDAISQFLPSGSQAELRLYGSRTQDNLKGGDIDLLLITETEASATLLKQHKAEIFGKIFSSIDEQKIDLLIIDTASVPKNPFAAKALSQSILLNDWGN